MTIRPINQGSYTPDGRNSPQKSSSGCVPMGLWIFVILWCVLTTVLSQVFVWALEQAIFDGSYVIPDVRWLIQLIYGALVVLPVVGVWFLWRALPARRLLAGIGLAGIFVMLLAPARLPGVTAALPTALLQIAGAAVFLVIERWLWRSLKAPEPVGHNYRFWGMALLVSAALGYPWVWVGALGSVWDTLLNLVAAALFGLVVARIARVVLWEHAQTAQRSRFIFVDGLGLALVLLILVSGLGANGNQWLLALCVPLLGWVLAALYAAESEDGAWLDNARVLGMVAGLAVAWPLLWIDPDEMAAVTSSGAGELIQWASLAAFVGLGIGLVFSFVFVLLRKRVADQPPGWLNGLAAAAWVGVILIYGIVGQPGLYGERLFVILRTQADLSQSAKTQDVTERRVQVYTTLVQTADSTQAGIRGTLDRFHIAYTPYYLENGLEVQGGPLLRWWLQTRPEVSRVLDAPILRPLPRPVPQSRGDETAPTETPWNLRMIGADRVWQELGVNGKGVIVGQSDSGVQGDHPELRDSYRGRNGSNDYNWLDPWNHTSAPTDIGGHGTHTLATVVGKSVGVAPGAQWIGCVNLARNLGNPAEYLDCMQFMLAPYPQMGDPLRDGKPEMGAQVLNNSWGCPPVEGCDANTLEAAVSALRAAGIFVVASAGNEGLGGCATVKDPIALYAQVYSVGAINELGHLAEFSSLGPVTVDGSQRMKPDIAAPGVDVLSAFPGNTYASLSGTSMAGPHVVGVVALMWSSNPSLVGDIDRTQQILDETASTYSGLLPECIAPGHPNNAVGFGVVNAYEAVRKAMGK